MKIICLVKFVPDIKNFKYDFEKNILIRDNVKMILNPDDGCAVALALKIKETNPDTSVEVVTMAPHSIIPLLEDLLRVGVDHATLISDKLYAGSDTYVTSRILSSYLTAKQYDCILTGTHAWDGDTSHVPAQLGEWLSLNQMSGITKVDIESISIDKAVFEVDMENSVLKYEINLPAILSITAESKYKLPYIKFEDISKDVTDNLKIISNEDLGFDKGDIGLKGSLTKVVRTYNKQYNQKNKLIVKNDDDGIEVVYSFLKDKGFL